MTTLLLGFLSGLYAGITFGVILGEILIDRSGDNNPTEHLHG
jgi:hypothetical protein